MSSYICYLLSILSLYEAFLVPTHLNLPRASLSPPRPPHWATASDGRHLSLPGGTSYLPSHYIFVRITHIFTLWYVILLTFTYILHICTSTCHCLGERRTYHHITHICTLWYMYKCISHICTSTFYIMVCSVTSWGNVVSSHYICVWLCFTIW